MGPGILSAGTLLTHSRSRAASRNELQGDVISLNCLRPWSELSLVLIVPGALQVPE